jgi:hypothetical protein
MESDARANMRTPARMPFTEERRFHSYEFSESKSLRLRLERRSFVFAFYSLRNGS